MLRPGFVHYATFPQAVTNDDVVATVKLVMDHGFQVVELSSAIAPAVLEAAASLIRRRGGAFFLSAGPEYVRTPRSLCDLRGAERASAVSRAIELLDLAASLGAENLMLVSGADAAPARRDTARAALIASLREVVAHRGPDAPRITLETFARERAPAQLLGPSNETLELMDAVGSTGVGVTIDLAHLVQLGEDVPASATTLARLSKHIHLSTCILQSGHPLDGDAHPSFDEPGVTLSLAAAARAVDAVASAGSPLGDALVVSVEIRRHHAEQSEPFVKACARYWASAAGARAPDGIGR